MNFLLRSFVAVALLLPSCANAMTLRSELLPSGMLLLHFDGRIMHNDYDRVVEFYRRLGQQYSGTKAVVSLNSPGGYVVEATKIAVFLHELNQSTAVAPGNRCVSACFMLFAAGKQRFVGRNATIAVHRVGEPGVPDDVLSRDLTVKMSRLLLSYGVSPQIIAKLVATDFDYVAKLDEADLRSMQVTMIDTSPGVALRPSAPPAAAALHQTPQSAAALHQTPQAAAALHQTPQAAAALQPPAPPLPVPTNRVARSKSRDRNYESTASPYGFTRY